jgi:uncharacterized lipoprotein YddW (UPF0748 family)
MMRFPLTISVFLITFSIAFWGCEQNQDSKPVEENPLEITSFRFEKLDPTIQADIDSANKEIHASIPRTANIKRLTPTIEYTDGAEVSPPSGYAYDFSSPLDFTLTKDERSVTYTAYVDTALSDDNQLKRVRFPKLYVSQSVDNKEITVKVPYGTDLSQVEMHLEVGKYARVEPASDTVMDLSQPVEITVTSESGKENNYTLMVEHRQQQTGVRAFWVPAPWHSPFLSSYKDIQEGVEFANEHNFNTLYIVAWSNNQILYPSQTLLDHSSYSSVEESMFGDYTGGTGDPLKDVITLAHQAGLKVVLWYEYGFMAKAGNPPTPQNNPVLAKHPGWVGINNQGNPANYNGNDYYFNAYDPDVRQFMLDMIMEAVRNYDIDGIQGDDRLPAMPRNAGYDTTTVRLYKEDHGGQEPPNDYNDAQWVEWRANILNQFWKQVYDSVKAEDPGCLVASSPNPYPWAFNNLMQDWPSWLEQGSVELLSVQCYRSSVASYNATIDEVLEYYTSHGDGDLQRLAPGLIVYGSDGLVDPGLLAAQIQSNRQRGIPGEAFFYDEPMRRDTIKHVLRTMYPAEAILPDYFKD